jgi:hypothetical protein
LPRNDDDVRVPSLKGRKAVLGNGVLPYGLEKTESFIGEGRPLFNAVCRLDLQGVVAKRLEDGRADDEWFKILNPTYSQKEGAERLSGGMLSARNPKASEPSFYGR